MARPSASGTSADGEGEDLKGAQTILDAAGLNCPTGKLGEGVWDELGTLYKLPRWVVSDPVNVSLVEEEDDLDVDADEGAATDDEDEDEEVDVVVKEAIVDANAADHGSGKGKGAAEEASAIKLKARLSDRGSDVIVSIQKTQTVKTVAKKIAEQAGLDSSRRIRLAYMGKILKENKTLDAQGWPQGHVINALVF